MTKMTDIGKEYGTALFMLAAECGAEAKREYAASLKLVSDTFRAEPSYAELLASPALPLGERLSIIDAAFGERLPEHVLSFIKLLCEKGRMACFPSAVDEYTALLDASERISNARVTSAVELTEDEKSKLHARLCERLKAEVKIEYFIDEGLLGGLIVEVDGTVIDGSLRHRLREVKEVMNG